MAKKERLKLGKLVKRYSVVEGNGFRLKDFDPADTAHFRSNESA